MAYESSGFPFESTRSPGETNIATITITFTAADIMIALGDPIAFRA